MNPIHRDGHRSQLAHDETSEIEQDALEFQLDPYELAYLRGGSRELLKLHLFELTQKGYLIVIEKKRWFRTDQWLAVAPDLPPAEELTETGQDLLTWFTEPQTAKDIFNHIFPEGLRADCLHYRTSLLQRGILTGWLAPESKISKYVWIVAVVGFILVIIESSALVLSPDAPFAYFVALVLVALVQYWFFVIRLTRSGKQYLKRLQNQFDHLRDQVRKARFGTSESTHLMAVAAFGTHILAGSSYDAFDASLGQDNSGGYDIEKGGGCDGSGCA
jgi:uncharacterized protein (TIGR04222 family)